MTRDVSALSHAVPTEGPLAGVRVIEAGQLLAGPFCGQLLGDLGAEVIKIEPPGAGDPMRLWGREKPHGQSLWWPVVARNKKSVVLDLRRPEGQEVVRRLVAVSDVLIENFRPGTLERWNLGYDVLAGINPRIVLTRVTGFGQTGPYAPRAGFGSVGEAMGGLRYVLGEPDRPPARAGISIGDSLAATYACIGTLAALQERRAVRARPDRRLGHLRGRAGDDGEPGDRVAGRRLPAGAHRRDPAEHRSVQCVPDRGRRLGAHRRQPGLGVPPADRRDG